MQINFKKVLNSRGVDKYQISEVLNVDLNYALDLIMYEHTCYDLTVENIRLVKRKFRIKADEFIEDKRPRTMTWKEVRTLLDDRSEAVVRTLKQWNWSRLRKDKFGDYPLAFLGQLCDELDINFKRLLFLR